jgi:hypothetical protein
MAKWRSRQIEPGALEERVDKDVFEKWVLKGAVRVLEISRSGWDAEPKGDLKNKRASDVATDEPISRRWLGCPEQRRATTGKTFHDYASQNPGRGPENDSGETQQRHTLEHAQHGQSRQDSAKRACAGSGISMV